MTAKLSSFSRERLCGAMLILVGLIFNEWLLAATLAHDAVIEDLTLRATIWVFNIVSLTAGSLLFISGTAALDVVYRYSHWPLIVVAALLFGIWLVALEQLYTGWGLFKWIGVDYGIYLAQAEVLRSGDAQSIYSREALQAPYQELYDRYLDEPATASQVPYPPLFAWLFGVFTLFDPHVGFILWTFLNSLAALYVTWRAVAFFREEERPVVALLFLTSYPAVYTLIVGQPSLLLACAVAEFYLALRRGRDLQAGVYLSLLLFKPQYGLLLGPLLIWNRRWAAVAGAALGGALIVVGSVLVAGLTALLNYPSAFTDMAQFRGDFPKHMINWRSLIIWLFPDVSDQVGMLLNLLLGGLTIVLTLLAWRGPWAPKSWRFPIQISLTLVATLLANHHSFQHGAVLLAVPLSSAFAEAELSRFSRGVVIAACLLPAMSFTLVFSLSVPYASRLLTVLLLLCYTSLLAELWFRARDRQLTAPAAPVQPA